MAHTTEPRYVVTWIDENCQLHIQATFTLMAAEYLKDVYSGQGCLVTVEPFVSLTPRPDAFNAPRLVIKVGRS